jgi:hypothetical protein
MIQADNAFVYALCGDSQVDLVNTSLRFLKRFTRQDIVVVASRCASPIQHDQVIRREMPGPFDDRQASILLKTNLHRLVGGGFRRCCYLDTDVIAVDGAIDEIFDATAGPVSFAADHSRLRTFSRWAVRCPCLTGDCDHLREAILAKFGIEVSDPDWQIWNGGVFVFDSDSTEFLDTWHQYTRSILADGNWRSRDQGTLVAAVWKQGLQNLPLLARTYNFVVDRMHGVEDAKRPFLRTSEYQVDRSYSLDQASNLLHPRFLHFINGGVGTRGWKNWDDAESRLGPVSDRT